jgi:hypothetical protein
MRTNNRYLGDKKKTKIGTQLRQKKSTLPLLAARKITIASEINNNCSAMNQDNRTDQKVFGSGHHPQAPDPSSLLLQLFDNKQVGKSTAQAPTQRRVDHTYRDHSNFPLEELPTRKRAPTNFPSKLHQILSNPEYSHVSRKMQLL